MAEHLNLCHSCRQEIRPKRGQWTDRKPERVRHSVSVAGMTPDTTGKLEAPIVPSRGRDIAELHQKLQKLASVTIELEELRSMIAVLELHIQDERSTQILQRTNRLN